MLARSIALLFAAVVGTACSTSFDEIDPAAPENGSEQQPNCDGEGGADAPVEEPRACQAPTGRYLSPTLKITFSGSTDPIYICGPDGVRLVYEKFLDPETCVYSGFVECHWCDGTWARTTFDLLVEEDGTLSGTVTNPVGTFSETWTPVRGAP